MKSSLQVVIPAAGAGTRFKSAGISVPKPLIRVGGIPMILWVIANLDLAENDSVIVICQEEDKMPKNLTEYLENIPFDISFLEINGLTSGPASTVSLALPRLRSEIPLVVANSDQYVSHDLSNFLSSVREAQFQGTILTMEASGNRWSYIGRNSKGQIDRIIEKQEISNEATVGIYAWSSPKLLSRSITFLKNENLLVNNEYYIAPSYGYLVSQEMPVGAFSVGDHGLAVHGLGTPEDLECFLMHPRFEQFREKVGAFYNGSS